MDQITKEYALKAIDSKIKKLTEFIEWQTRLVEDHTRQLKTKQGSAAAIGGGLGADIAYDGSTSAKIVRESTEKLEKSTAHLEKYKIARANIENTKVKATAKDKIIKKLEELEDGITLGCYDNQLAQLKKVLDNLDQEWTNVEVTIRKRKYVVEIVTVDSERDFSMITKEEYVARYGDND